MFVYLLKGSMPVAQVVNFRLTPRGEKSVTVHEDTEFHVYFGSEHVRKVMANVAQSTNGKLTLFI